MADARDGDEQRDHLVEVDLVAERQHRAQRRRAQPAPSAGVRADGSRGVVSGLARATACLCVLLVVALARMLLPTLLIISGVGGRLAELADGVLG